MTRTNTIVKRALKDAVRWGRLVRNPADAVDALRRQMRPELALWDAEALSDFLGAEAEEDRHAPLWGLSASMASTGMRRGQALGLRWCDVDLKAGVLRGPHAGDRRTHPGGVGAEDRSGSSSGAPLYPHCVDAAIASPRPVGGAGVARLGSLRSGRLRVFTMPDGSALHPDRVP